ncbi:MAG TPA: glycoside hydrolase family 97 protein [Bacteroidales bacterium]|nr:glycoside hydrolase family 97 protein [Bacteroidales bacterium]
MRNTFKITLLAAVALLISPSFAAKTEKPLVTTSPDGKIIISLTLAETPVISITYSGETIMSPSKQSLSIREFPAAWRNPKIKKINTRTVDEVIIAPVAEKRSHIPDQYNETEVWFKSNCGIKLRAYNDGAAWRFITKLPDSVTINNESVTLTMAQSDSLFFGEEDNFHSHSERFYPIKSAADITGNQMCILPAVFRKNNGVIAAFTEADLLDYPGLYLGGTATGTATFRGILPQAAATEKVSDDRRSYLVDTRHDYIARTTGTREYPWRVFGICASDAKLLENDIVYRLGSPCKIKDTGWIKPGKVAWDWWNDWNIYNVPFKAGINTETYKYYIDFASANKLEYVIFDEGWSANDDLDKINPDMDMDALFAYAKQKNVRIILWVTGRALQDKFYSSLDKFEKWGCAGIKMDFMIRDDQKMVNFYEKVAVETAKRHMLADFHGSFKPTGLSRTYPNQLTREGVRGMENDKWSDGITPAHDCTLPFTRMFAGPMDYTPGAMTNATKKNFTISWSEPMSQGTRCHEFAKYIIFESPLQMLCDAPTRYILEPDVMKFLAPVPTTWDETVGLEASIGHFAALARRQGDTWYIGSMTDWTSRSLDLDLSFLGEGKYKLECWYDGPNADRKGSDYLTTTKTVDRSLKLRIDMASGGGYVARITKL